MAQAVKNPPATRETCVQSLGWEAPLEEGMAPHSHILDWRIPHGQRSRLWSMIMDHSLQETRYKN